MIALNDEITVAGQISPADVHAWAAAGGRMIVNNRPDGEDLRQPAGATIAAACADAGLSYRAIPVTHAGIAPEQVAAMAAALRDTDGPVLAFCRSGTRSTYLWALAAQQRGGSADTIAADAAKAGHDIRPLLA